MMTIQVKNVKKNDLDTEWTEIETEIEAIMAKEKKRNVQMRRKKSIVHKKETKMRLIQVITQVQVDQVLAKQTFQDKPETTKISIEEVIKIEIEKTLMEAIMVKKNKTVWLTQWREKDSTWMIFKNNSQIEAIRTEI